MKNEIYYKNDDCPNCGQKDEMWANKGASMGSTTWGHDFLCCSEHCGREFLNSPKHKQLMRERIKAQIEILERQLSHWH